MVESAEILIHGVVAARVVTKANRKEIAISLMDVSKSAINIPARTIVGYEEAVSLATTNAD